MSFKPNISDKSKGSNKITLVRGNAILSKDEDVAKEFENMFSNAVNKLTIPAIPVNEIPDYFDSVDTAVLKYKDHPSVLRIIDQMSISEDEFNFQDFIYKQLRN